MQTSSNQATLFHFVFIISSCLATSVVQADWPSWRGPRDSGAIETGIYPASFDDASTRWRIALPGKGCSTPIVLDQNIYLTAPVDGNDAILSYGSSGAQRWSTTFGPENAGKHRNGSGATDSPKVDLIFTHHR